MENTEKTMSETKTTRTIKRSASKQVKPRTVDDVKLSDRVSIDNLCDWEIGFVSAETGKDITIAPGIKNFKGLTVAEVDSQVKLGNGAFCGVDNLGSHAAIRINDPIIREYVFQEETDPLQLTEETVRDLLSIQNKQKFNERLSELVVRRSEKRMIVRLVDRIGKDDVPSYQIAAIEKISGIKFDY